MAVFPQLTTGAAALYPLRRSRRRRSVINTLGDGSQLRYSDPDLSETQWRLEAVGLSGEEWGAIETLFADVRGRFGTFKLLEPVGNLLLQSEGFDQPEWDNSPLTSVSGGQADPLGETGAATITGTSVEVAQVLAVPGNFQYSLSVWVKSAVGATATLFATTTGGSNEKAFMLSAAWTRIAMPVAMGLATDSVKFGVRLTDAAQVFGMQVEAQPGAGGYQKTDAKGGVHEVARFDEDALTVRARGTDVFDAVIRIVTKGS
jgi:hypothetical protein